jgi:hypothetical protein
MASDATDGRAFQGFLVPELVTLSYQGTTANEEWGAPEVASGTAETTWSVIPTGTPDGVTEGQSVYLYPVRPGAPGPDGAAYMWQPAASYSAAVSAGAWRGWDAPTLIRWTGLIEAPSGGDTVGAPCIVGLADRTAYAFWEIDDGSSSRLRYSTWDGSTWAAAADTGVTGAGTAIGMCPAAVTPDGASIVYFYAVDLGGSMFQVNMRSTVSGLEARSVLPASVDGQYGLLGMLAATANGQILLLVNVENSTGTTVIRQYASNDGGVTFALVEAWDGYRTASAIAVTPSGFVACCDRLVSAGVNRPDVRRIGTAFTPLSAVAAVDPFPSDSSTAEQAQHHMLIADPAGALHLLRSTSDPAADAANQAVSLDGGATWQAYGGGLLSAVSGRGWCTTRSVIPWDALRAAWLGDSALVVGLGDAGDIISLRLGGAAVSPMYDRYTDLDGGGGPYALRPLWSASWLPFGSDRPDQMGWTDVGTGTISRAFGGDVMTEVVQTGEVSAFNLSLAAATDEVIGRWVIGDDLGGTLDATMRVISGDNTNYVTLEVVRTGSTWVYKDNGGSGVALLTSALYPVEVIIAASIATGRGRIIVREWGNDTNLATAAMALTSAAGGADSAVKWDARNPSAASVSIDLYAMDAAFTEVDGVLASSSLGLPPGRPVSAEAPTYIGAGLSLQATGGTLTGSAKIGVPWASSTGAANLDPSHVMSPRRRFVSEDDAGTAIETLTVTRRTAGWTSELMALHLEGCEGFESVKVELYDDENAAYTTLGTFSRATTGLYWQRHPNQAGTVIEPRQSGSTAGTRLWLDRGAANGAEFATSQFGYFVVETFGGTWVDGAAIAESRAKLRIDIDGNPDDLIGADTSGTAGVIRWPSMTILFQPQQLGLGHGFSSVRLTFGQGDATKRFPGGAQVYALRKLLLGPVVVLPRELTRSVATAERGRVERIDYPDGSLTIARRGPRGQTIDLAYTHSHAPLRYDRWATSPPDYLQTSTAAIPIATADDVVGVLRGLAADTEYGESTDDASGIQRGPRPMVWLPYIPTALDSGDTYVLAAPPNAGVYGVLSPGFRRSQVVGREAYSAEYTVDTFTFERLTWERE